MKLWVRISHRARKVVKMVKWMVSWCTLLQNLFLGLRMRRLNHLTGNFWIQLIFDGLKSSLFKNWRLLGLIRILFSLVVLVGAEIISGSVTHQRRVLLNQIKFDWGLMWAKDLLWNRLLSANNLFGHWLYTHSSLLLRGGNSSWWTLVFGVLCQNWGARAE